MKLKLTCDIVSFQMHKFLYYRSKLIEESIRYPDDLEDEIFDDFARQSCSETDFDIPFLPNKAEMKQ